MRRRKRKARFLYRHRRFCLVCLVLAGLFIGFRYSIARLSARTERIDRELAQLDSKYSLSADPQAAIAERMRLEYKRVEFAFYALFLAIPAVFLSIAIILIYKSGAKGTHWERRERSPQRLVEDDELREKVRAHFEAQRGDDE